MPFPFSLSFILFMVSFSIFIHFSISPLLHFCRMDADSVEGHLLCCLPILEVMISGSSTPPGIDVDLGLFRFSEYVFWTSFCFNLVPLFFLFICLFIYFIFSFLFLRYVRDVSSEYNSNRVSTLLDLVIQLRKLHSAEDTRRHFNRFVSGFPSHVTDYNPDEHHSSSR